jgi:hypothetical protein
MIEFEDGRDRDQEKDSFDEHPDVERDSYRAARIAESADRHLHAAVVFVEQRQYQRDDYIARHRREQNVPTKFNQSIHDIDSIR